MIIRLGVFYYLISVIFIYIFLSSPFLFVYGDDRVILHGSSWWYR